MNQGSGGTTSVRCPNDWYDYMSNVHFCVGDRLYSGLIGCAVNSQCQCYPEVSISCANGCSDLGKGKASCNSGAGGGSAGGAGVSSAGTAGTAGVK